jgi:hypothetical protein
VVKYLCRSTSSLVPYEAMIDVGAATMMANGGVKTQETRSR